LLLHLSLPLSFCCHPAAQPKDLLLALAPVAFCHCCCSCFFCCHPSAQREDLLLAFAVVLAFLAVIPAEPALSEAEWGICFSLPFNRDLNQSQKKCAVLSSR
jgi:hypothetical protein